MSWAPLSHEINVCRGFLVKVSEGQWRKKRMLEKEIEEKLVEKVRGLNGLCLKFTSPSLTGVPDRMILLPKGKIGFVEVKRKGQRPKKIQRLRIKQLKELGFLVFVLDDREKIEEILDEIQAT